MKPIFLLTILALLCSCQTIKSAFSPKDAPRTVRKEPARSNVSDTVAHARKLLGIPYVYGGDSPKGFDCSGLSYYVFKKENITLPRVSRDQASQGKKVPIKNAQPGDLVFFKNKGEVNHVGIVSTIRDGELYMIHSSSSRGVVEDPVTSSPYWNKRLAYVKRVK